MADIFTESGRTLARMIRDKDISSAELVDAYIKRIEGVNSELNAVVCERFDEARREAEAVDQKLASSSEEELPPYFGVPCSVKECFAFKGMPQSAGLVSRKNVVAEEDSLTVQRLRAAGAIPLGVTNTSELCMWMESNNKLYGRTNNPYDLGRTAGGSSGGEGALIGSGASPFGIGSDIGGSIRMPAFFNGIFGHKPSSRLIPNQGQYPPAENDANLFLSTGPLARRAEDLMPLVKVFAGPSARDETCVEMSLGDCDEIDIKELTVISIADNGRIGVSDDLRQAQVDALQAFQQAGAKVEDRRLNKLRESLGIWSAMMSNAADTPYVEHLRDGQSFSLAKESLKMSLGRSQFTLPSLGLVAIEGLSARAHKHSARMMEIGKQLRAELDEMLGPNTLLLFPSYPSVAPPHKHPLRLPIHWQYTAIINVMELPATQVPLGLGEAGLPLGVQVIGGHGRDHLCIAAALFLEKTFGGWTPPPLRAS